MQAVAGFDQRLGDGARRDAPERGLELGHGLAPDHLPECATIFGGWTVGALGSQRLESFRMAAHQRQRLIGKLAQGIERRVFGHGKQDVVGVHPATHPETLRVLVVIAATAGLIHRGNADLRGQQPVGRLLGILHRMPQLGRLVQHHTLQGQRNAGAAQRLRRILVMGQFCLHFGIGEFRTIDGNCHDLSSKDVPGAAMPRPTP